MTLGMSAQTKPTIDPTATVIRDNGAEESGTLFSGPAPLTVEFKANAENTGGYSTYYEWRFKLEGEEEPYLVRYEEDFLYLFEGRNTRDRVVCHLRAGNGYRVLHTGILDDQDTHQGNGQRE